MSLSVTVSPSFCIQALEEEQLEQFLGGRGGGHNGGGRRRRGKSDRRCNDPPGGAQRPTPQEAAPAQEASNWALFGLGERLF